MSMMTSNPVIKYKKKIGENIAKYRKLKKLSQKELSKFAGITPQTLSCIETGVNNPSFNVMIKISQALDIPLAYIFTFDDTIFNIEDKELLFLATESFKDLNYSQRKIVFRLIECFKEESKS